MTWRDQLRPASFRGVPFKVEGCDTDGEQRIATHRYPYKNKASNEELGLDQQTFSVRAYVIGNDYITQRDALIRQMRTPGPGTLVLPTQGSLKVIPKSFRQSWSRDEGGIEYLDLVFYEHSSNSYPSTASDSKSQVLQAGDKARNSIQGAFSKKFGVQGYQDFVNNSAQGLAGNLSSSINNAGNIRAKLPDQASIFQESINDFNQSIPSLVLSAANYASRVIALVGQIRPLFSTPQDAFTAYLQLSQFGQSLIVPAGITRNQQQQAINQDMVVSMTRRAALISMAETATEIDFASYDDAVALRDSLAGQLDDELLLLGDTDLDDIYLDLGGVMSTMITDITTRAANLERIRSVTYQQTLPALVIAYSIYQSTDRADEIVARNKIQHPGFVPGGVPVQILI
jgi:prophage DNA circulation protein